MKRLVPVIALAAALAAVPAGGQPPGYQPAPHAPHLGAGYERVVLVPRAVPVGRPSYDSPYFFDVGAGYRDSLLADAAAFRALLAFRVLNGQAAPGEAAGAHDPVPRIPPDPSEATARGGPKPARAARVAGGDAAKVKALLDGKCLRCHTAPTPKNTNVGLADPAAVAKGVRWACFGKAAAGDMPPGGPQLPPDELAVLYGWAGAAE